MKERGSEFVSRQMWRNVSGTRKEGKSVNMVISPGSGKTLNICSVEEKQMCCGQEQPPGSQPGNHPQCFDESLMISDILDDVKYGF